MGRTTIQRSCPRAGAGAAQRVQCRAMRRGAAFVTALGAMLASATVRAQSATPTVVPPSRPLTLGPLALLPAAPSPAGDTRGVMTEGETRAWLEPLRLELTGMQLGTARFHLGCATREAAPSASFIHALTPKLSLFGASAGGCVADNPATGGVAFTTPLAGRAWLVLSTTITSIPTPEATPRVVRDTSAKIVLPSADRKTGYSIGVGTRGVTFGGLW